MQHDDAVRAQQAHGQTAAAQRLEAAELRAEYQTNGLGRQISIAHLHVESTAAKSVRSVTASAKKAAKMRLSGLAAGVAGVASLYRHEAVQKVEATDPGVGVAHTVHNAAVRGRVPARRCRELDFAVYVAGEAHGNRDAGGCSGR